MRTLVVVVATCLVSTLARAQSSRSILACPSPDSIRAESDRRSAAPSESGQVHMSIRETPSRLRYVTYVVDSQYVLLTDQSAADSGTRNPLSDLRVADIQGIYVLKEKAVPGSWRRCPEVPVMLILTKSRSWRPRGVRREQSPDARPGATAPATPTPARDTLPAHSGSRR
jgi:hypothetical protein